MHLFFSRKSTTFQVTKAFWEEEAYVNLEGHVRVSLVEERREAFEAEGG